MFDNFQAIWLLLILPAAAAWWVQQRVRRAHARYRRVPNDEGLNGEEIAHILLRYAGLEFVRIRAERGGALVDFYNPTDATLHLSHAVMNEASVSAMGIVAHEVAHAVQDQEKYGLMRIRMALAGPLTVIGQLSPFVFIGGMFFGSLPLIIVGAGMLGFMVLFSLVTLPVETNATSRALDMLEKTGLANTPEEREGVRSVLRAASLTYLAGLARTFASFLFLAAIVASALGISL